MIKIWWGRAYSGRLRRRGVVPAVLAVILTFAVAAATVPGSAQAQSYRFSQFAVEGNQRVDDATVLSYADIVPGQTVSQGELNQAFRDIQASGLFEDVRLVPRGSTLVIQVQEWATVNRIVFEGNRRVSDDVLSELVRTTPRRVFSPLVAEQDAARIVEAYEAQGFLIATVEPRIIRRSENRVDLVFEITEGRVVENERISFVGNRAFSDRRLRRVLETKQAGLLRALFRTDTFIADRLEFDERLLTDFYQSRGYIDFRVLDITTELSRERNATFITVQVQEGQQFSFGRISASSEVNGVNAQEFLEAARLRTGVVYSPVLVENAITRMEGLATQKGLDFIRFEPRVVRNNRDLSLDIEFVIARGERIFVERIDIEGNQTTLDRVIRRQFRVVEGDPFNPREIRNAAQRIRALNYFANVEVDSREGSAPDQVIIDVDVEEQPTGSLGFGASFNTDSGLGFTINFTETNFLGRGQRLIFDLSNTEETGSSQITFTEPALYGRQLSWTISAFRFVSDNNNAEFNTENLGASTSLTFPFGEFSSLSVQYAYEQLDLSELTSDSSPILQRERGSRTASRIGYSYIYDTRTRGLDPNAGILLSFGQNFAGIGGDVDYLETRVRAVAQRRLRNEDYGLRATFEAGNITGLNDYDTRVTERFFLSTQQLRGFDFRGVGPRDLDAVNEDPLGGNNFVSARFEFGFPIGFAEEIGLSGGLFFDVGSVWGLDDTDGAGGPESVDDSFKLRSSVGLTLFWETALGPLAFNFSYPVAKEDFDEDRSFDITFSTRF